MWRLEKVALTQQHQQKLQVCENSSKKHKNKEGEQKDDWHEDKDWY